MSCKECGCTKVAEHSLEEKASKLSLSEKREKSCGCSAKVLAAQSGCCNSRPRPSRGCSCCCRSCCACCRCCSGTTRDFCQDRIRETTDDGCDYCNKREAAVRPATCACQN